MPRRLLTLMTAIASDRPAATCSRLVVLCILAVTACAVPAGASWSAGGMGTGSAVAATMPAGLQPSASAAGRDVTVTWTQSAFLDAPLGSYTGGGYLLRRFAHGEPAAAEPAASCATTISGAAPTLRCVEAGVPYGSWQYAITPVLNTFTGDESVKSAPVTVATEAPALSSAIAQNPTIAQTTGDVHLSWAPADGATGYNVYRRTTTGTYDFASPLNGAAPIHGTAYSDPGSGLSDATTYHYLVRAVAGSPVVESPSSNALSATTISRPAAPEGVTATAAAGAVVDVTWSSVSAASGYNVYRRPADGSYDFAAPLNGSAPVAGGSYADVSALDATSYRYTVRAVAGGAGGAQVESLDGTESPAVTADGVAPPAPTAVSVTSGGKVWNSTNCSIAFGTRYINADGRASVGVSATIAAPEPDETVVFSATTAGSTAVEATVAAGGTSVATTLDLTSLLDGTVTLSARTRDRAGNRSASRVPTNVVIKDVVAPPLTATYSGGALGLGPNISGSTECGATIIAVKTGGGNLGKTFSTTISSGTSYTLSVEGSLLGLGSVSYSVTSTDRAGNVSGATLTGG